MASNGSTGGAGSAVMLAVGFVSFLVGVLAILIGFALGARQPGMGRPFVLVGLLACVLGVGLVVGGLALLFFSALRGRRGRR